MTSRASSVTDASTVPAASRSTARRTSSARLQIGSAFTAAAIAWSSWSAVQAGARAMTRAVAGFTTAKSAPPTPIPSMVMA